MNIPFKKLSAKTWLQILLIWTLVALSMAVQVYLTSIQWSKDEAWWSILGKQLLTWYLCAALTPVVMYFYDRHPLDVAHWKRNLIKQFCIALLTLVIFSVPRCWLMHYISNRNPSQLNVAQHINFYLAQIAWDFAIYTFIVTILFANTANRKRKEKELFAADVALKNKELEAQLNAAQLEALKLQLSPHFLFNTLNTINALIRAGEYQLAIQINTRLGDFLRTTLYAEQNQFVSLEQELEFVDLYLAIESLRFSDRLKIVKDVPKECRQVRVPHFILQPVIENAIKHGIAKKSSAGLIALKAEKEGEFLQLTIYNEGKPLTKPWQAAEGIGLKNIVKRLHKIYGDNHYFSVHNLEDKEGVQVVLSIPLN